MACRYSYARAARPHLGYAVTEWFTRVGHGITKTVQALDKLTRPQLHRYISLCCSCSAVEIHGVLVAGCALMTQTACSLHPVYKSLRCPIRKLWPGRCIWYALALIECCCLQASGLAGKASVGMMGWDVTHSGKKGKMSIAEATQCVLAPHHHAHRHFFTVVLH